MLLLKTCTQVIFFGFLTLCSTSMISAMTDDGKKSVIEIGARRTTVENTDAILLHRAAVQGDVKNVQRLCTQYTEAKTLATIINRAESIQSGVKALKPIEYALAPLICHINTHFDNGNKVSRLENYDGKSPEGFHRLAVEWLITMKILLANGAILKEQSASQVLLEALRLAVNDEKSIDDNKMGKVLKQLYDAYAPSMWVKTAVIQLQLANRKQ